MTTPLNNTDLDALIDLLGIDDDDTGHADEKGSLFRSDLLTPETGGLEESESSSGTVLPSFHSGDSLELGDFRQYTPATVTQEGNRLSPLPSSSHGQAVFAAVPSPEPAELQMPAFPPMAPTLRSVRSTNHIPAMTLKFGAPDHVVELLPVSPFLLSPQTAGLDQTRSPFFSESSLANTGSPLSDSRTISSLTASPMTASPLRHPVLPNEEVASDVQDYEESQVVLNESSPAADQSININISNRLASPAMERLTRELSLARSEIASLRGQCDELRILATNNHFRGVPTDTPKFSGPYENGGPSERVEVTATQSVTEIERARRIFDDGRGDADLTPEPEVHSASGVGGRWDDIDKISGDDARHALKSILSYFSLPPSSLRTLPSLHRPVGHEAVTGSSPRSNIHPLSSHASSSSLPRPSTFSQIKRAVTFLSRADELVWKRTSLSNSRPSPRRAHSQPHLTLLTSSPHSNSNIQVPGLSPARRSGGKSSSDPAAGAAPGDGAASVQRAGTIFEEKNVKALEDRLSLWERAVRTKMSRPKR